MQADLYPPINLLVFCADTFKVGGPPALIMGQTPEPRTEARTETTTLVVEETTSLIGFQAVNGSCQLIAQFGR